MIKIGIIADKDARASYKTQDIFMKIFNQFGNTFEIYTPGQTDVELQFKKIALEKNCKYGEFNYASSARNVYSMLSESYYGKKFHPTHEPDSHIRLYRHADRVIVFNAGNLKEEKFLKMGEKAKSKTVIINL